MAPAIRWMMLGAALAALVAADVRPLRSQAGSHCSCSGGSCPIVSGERACSCGCRQLAEAQAAVDMSPRGPEPCVGGRAGPFPCDNVDLLAFLPLGEIGSGTANDIWGWTDPLTGREYALLGRSTGVSIVDVSTPTAPVYVGDLPTHTVPSLWRGIKVFADHLFVVSEAANHGMQVFDLRAVRSVTARPARFTETAHYAQFGSAHNIVMDTESGHAYAVGTKTCEGGLHIVDIRDPVHPTQAGCYARDGYTHDAQCLVYRGPDARYAGRQVCFAANEDTLTIVDVTAKRAPREISRTGYGGASYTHQGWLTEDQGYLLVDDEGDERAFNHRTRTWIWDVRSLTTPRLIGWFEGRTGAIDHNLFIRGSVAYEANYRAGLSVLDITGVDAARLVERGWFDVYPDDDLPAFNGAWGNYPFLPSGTILVSGIEQGLFLLRPRWQPQPPPAGLSVSIVASPDPAPVGGAVSYVVSVRNRGPSGAAGVVLTTTLPEGAVFVRARATQGNCRATSTVGCDLGTLAAGGTAIVVLEARPERVGTLVGRVSVTSSATDADPSDNVASASTAAAMLPPRRRPR